MPEIGRSYSRGCGTDSWVLLGYSCCCGWVWTFVPSYILCFFRLLFRCPNDSFLMFEFLWWNRKLLFWDMMCLFIMETFISEMFSWIIPLKYFLVPLFFFLLGHQLRVCWVSSVYLPYLWFSCFKSSAGFFFFLPFSPSRLSFFHQCVFPFSYFHFGVC